MLVRVAHVEELPEGKKLVKVRPPAPQRRHSVPPAPCCAQQPSNLGLGQARLGPHAIANDSSLQDRASFANSRLAYRCRRRMAGM